MRVFRPRLWGHFIRLCLLAGCAVGTAPSARAEGMDRAVWPYRFSNEHYSFLGDLARGFEGANQKVAETIRFGSDDKGSVGRFADRDNPFGLLIDWPATHHGKHRIALRFQAGKEGMPTEQLLAQRRIVVVASRDLYLERVSRAGLRWLLRADSKDWPETGQEKKQRAETKILLGGDEKSWLQYHLANYVLRKTLNRTGRAEGRMYDMRKDVVRKKSAADVLAEVRKGRKMLGVVVWEPGLNFSGVDLLQVRNHWKEDWVKPDVATILQSEYELGEKLIIYTHPLASPEVQAFGQWAQTEEAAIILERYGLQTLYAKTTQESTQRLKQMKAGKGPQLPIVGPRTFEPLTMALATNYVRAREVVVPKYAAGMSLLSNVSGLVGGRSELLVTDVDLRGETELSQLRHFRKKWEALKATEYVMGSRAVGVVVNAANGLEAISIDGLRKVYTGQARDWLDVGPTGLEAADGKRPMTSYGLYSRLPAGALFDTKVLGKQMPRFVKKLGSTADVVRAVRAEPGAIGVVDLTQLPDDLAGLRILPIEMKAGEFVYPTAAAIQVGKYPLAQPVYLYVHPKASETTKRFVEFVATTGKSAANPYTDVVKSVTDTLLKNGLLPMTKEAVAKLSKHLQARPAVVEDKPARKSAPGKKPKLPVSGGW